ncbi:MAG: tRNA adenosine(34) deaminase TadA [Candidatus Binatia bacterium]
MTDRRFMEMALDEARAASELGEVPVGAVLVREDEVIATGHNRSILDNDPTAHAEVVALRAAAQKLENHRCGGCLYVTLEPCVMCMGALVQARVERLVYAASDPKAGAASSLYAIASDERLNHRFVVEAGLMSDISAALLRAFFSSRRDVE